MKSMTDTSIGILVDKNLETITLHVEGTSNL